MNIKAVIFDLDGVLTSSSREHFLAWAELAKRLGHKLSGHVFEDVKGISRMKSLDIVLKDIGMADKFPENEKIRLASLKNDIYVDMISKFDESNLAPGAAKLLELLKQNKIIIALASASKNSRMLLENMKIIGYFDYIADPSAVKNPKPAPDIFLDAAKHFSIEDRYCVGIEDAPAGITAIKAAGMFAVGIGNSEILSGADIVFRGLDKVDLLRIDRLAGQL